MPHIWKSCTTKLAKNTGDYKIRLQSVGRNSISGWRVNFIPIRRNTRTRGESPLHAHAHTTTLRGSTRAHATTHSEERAERSSSVCRREKRQNRPVRQTVWTFCDEFIRVINFLTNICISVLIFHISLTLLLSFFPLTPPRPPPLPASSVPRAILPIIDSTAQKRRDSVSFHADNPFTILMEKLDLKETVFRESMRREFLRSRLLSFNTIIPIAARVAQKFVKILPFQNKLYFQYFDNFP